MNPSYPELPVSRGTINQIVFDLDGTIAEANWPTRRTVGKPIAKGVAMLKHYAEQGFSICIYTARPAVDEPAIWQWVFDNELPVDKVVCDKPSGALYVDDKGWRFDG